MAENFVAWTGSLVRQIITVKWDQASIDAIDR